MAALREIIARFGVSFDDSALKKGEKAVDGLANKLASLGKALASGLVAGGLAKLGQAAWGSVAGLASQADALAKQATALGVSITQLQEWHYAAAQSGSSAEEFSAALTQFSKVVANSASGTGPAAEAFRRLGVSVRDSAGNLGQPIELLEGVAAGLQRIQNPAERANVVMSIFGKSGAKLIPLFAEGAEGIAKMRAEFQELGGGFSPEFSKQSEDFSTALGKLNVAWLSFRVRLGGIVVPMLERFMTLMTTKVLPTISAWTKRLEPLAKNSNIAVAAVVTLGTAFLVAGLKALAPWIPLLATLAAIAIVVDDIMTFFQGGDSLIGRGLDAAFGPGTQDKVRDWFKGLYKSVKELFTDTERALTEFEAGLRLMWHDLTTWMGDLWSDLGTNLALVFVDAVTKVKTAIGTIQDSFGELWNKINDGIDNVPGLRFLLGKLGVSGQRAVGGNAAAAQAKGDERRQRILDKSDARRAANEAERQRIIDSSVVTGPAVATAPAPPPANVNAPVEVNVTVPPGTPAQQARNIGEIVRKVMKQSNNAKLAALVRTAG